MFLSLEKMCATWRSKGTAVRWRAPTLHHFKVRSSPTTALICLSAPGTWRNPALPVCTQWLHHKCISCNLSCGRCAKKKKISAQPRRTGTAHNHHIAPGHNHACARRTLRERLRFAPAAATAPARTHWLAASSSRRGVTSVHHGAEESRAASSASGWLLHGQMSARSCWRHCCTSLPLPLHCGSTQQGNSSAHVAGEYNSLSDVARCSAGAASCVTELLPWSCLTSLPVLAVGNVAPLPLF